jgi:phage gp46-like protein
MLSLLVYAGKGTEFDSRLITADTKTTAIVLKLVEPLLKEGRTVWMDNFYNSPCLAKILKIVHKTDCVGTLKLNRKNVPKNVKDTKLKER